MGMRINQNITAMNSYRNLSVTEGQLSKSLEKLSSGFRINRAADDAAGLAISEKLRGQVSGLNTASANAQNGISLIQTAEGALNETHSILQRMRELSVQSANDTNTTADRGQIQKEVDELAKELTRIGDTTEFNTKKLLNGDSDSTPLTLQVGANEGQTLTVKIGNMGAVSLGVGSDVAAVAASAGSAAVAGTPAVAGTAAVPASATSGSNTGTVTGAPAAGTYTVTDDGAGGYTVGGGDGSESYADNGDGTFTLTAGGGSVNFAADVSGLAGSEPDVVVTAEVAAVAGTPATAGTAAVSATTASAASVKGIDVSSSSAAAGAAITTIDAAISKVSDQRSTLGAAQNRLDHVINNLGVAAENLSASESRIRDTDMAAEMMKFTRSQILSQAGTAMLAQANQVPQGVLQLLR